MSRFVNSNSKANICRTCSFCKKTTASTTFILPQKALANFEPGNVGKKDCLTEVGGGRGRKKLASSSASSSSDFFSPSPIHFSARGRPGKKRKRKEKTDRRRRFSPFFHFRDNNCPGEKLLRKKKQERYGEGYTIRELLRERKSSRNKDPITDGDPLSHPPSHINTFMRGGKAKTTQTRSLGLFFLERKSWDSPIIIKQSHRTIANLTNNIGFPNSKHLFWNSRVESHPRSTVAECSSWLVLMCLVTRETSVEKRAFSFCPWH